MQRLKALALNGQAIWLDYICRNMLESGELRRLVEADGLTGVTSNPAIFEQAIGKSPDYDAQIRSLLDEHPEIPTEELYEHLAVVDIRLASDLLLPIYEATRGGDGFVSLEVSPHLARDTDGTVAEARRLWQAVDRPNLMIKVPATREGIPAVETLLAQGINVNITLMFSLAHYEAVAQAYLRGVGRAAEPSMVASVASFFVSRIDTKVDRALAEHGSEEALTLRGKIAIANCRLTYRRFREIFSGQAFDRLARRGARLQRVLWASTSAKNPAYRDVLYVEELIGSDTINTLPPQTVDAFRDHGQARASIEEGVGEAEAQIKRLSSLGIDFDAATEELQEEGVEKFIEPYDRLLATLDAKRERVMAAVAG